MIYLVCASGCDDSTEVLVDLTDAERDAVAKVADLISAASTHSCMPRLGIRTATTQEIADFEETEEA